MLDQQRRKDDTYPCLPRLIRRIRLILAYCDSLMRGIGFRSEALSSHFVCPSCCTRLFGDGYLRGSSVHTLRTRYTAQQLKMFSTQAYSPWIFKPIKTIWNSLKLKHTEPSESPFLMQALSFNLDTHRRTEAELKRGDGKPYKSLTSELMDTYYSTDDGIIDYLDRETPDIAVYAFLGPEQVQTITYNLPEPSFAEALSLLTPSHFIEPHKRLHRRFHPAVAYAKGYKTLEVIFDEFKRVLHFAVERRREAGFILGIAEYTHLLDCARSMGDADMADWLWYDMAVDEIEPTTACYNHYMEAKGWHHAYVSKEKYNLRFTPWVYRKRSYINRNTGYQGYGTGAENSVRKEVLQLYDEMVAKGQQPDEVTYISIMTASSREGHIVAVNNVLKTVWNIDVEQIMAHEDPANIPPVKQFSPTSPLHPTSRLLYAVAHIFGSNNDLSTALQLVDFISTSYNIPIPDSVWLELVEWSFVLSSERWGPRAKENSVGKVPKETVKALFDTMTSNPYNVKPTIPLYDMLITTSWTRSRLDHTLKYMREGCALFQETLKRRDTAKQAFVEHLLTLLPENIQWQVKLKKTYQRLQGNLWKSSLEIPTNAFMATHPDSAAANGSVADAKEQLQQMREAKKYIHYLREDLDAQITGKAPSYINERWAQRQIRRLELRERQETAEPHEPSISINLSVIKKYRTMKAAFNLEQLNTSRDATIIERWVRLLLDGRRWDQDVDHWQFRLIPRLLQEWERFLPQYTYYNIRTGVVEFQPASFWPNGKRERPEKGLSDLDLRLSDPEENKFLKAIFTVIGEHPNGCMAYSHNPQVSLHKVAPAVG
ncbi:hypothetical protein PAAG_02521 [Paracoccidioides lutzii Pb01]|uniref:ATPase expression protein 2, mitochondrial n=1 Tax=Paracoccidioides lutzii (strain ATCC MYA-826 / Pb01) TaxID=502779 RepID=C1GV48_PARBA|nr:hypothetical protein PAAG_02521 [Paracoccidioides lutzii Pb01]EEH40466.2 hypothetical protein PAAG_02521 [Paracoccidioides lutzii Pb01]